MPQHSNSNKVIAMVKRRGCNRSDAKNTQLEDERLSRRKVPAG
jgi:hypothetical protein